MATTQGVRQTTLNATRSSNFVRFMLAGALHKIAFKRGVFPRGSFAPSDRFGGAEALQASDDPVARRLLDQLGKGVFAAVKAKYARTITYYVVGPPSVAAKGERGGDENGADFSEKGDSFEDADDETERVLEEYAFTIRYGDETSPADAAAAGPAGDVFENVSVRATTKTSRRLDASVSGGRERGPRASSSLDDEEKIKDAGDQMLLQLEALIEHLDPVPVGSRIGIRLTYVDATPPEYEPPFFESVEPSGNAEHRLKFRGEQTECGSVETRFHSLSLKWTGLAGADQDLAEDGADDEANLPLDAKRKASALFPFPFESQPEPEPEPVVECRDYHYLSQSEPQLDSESQGLGAARGPARSPPRIGWADGFAGGPANGRATGPVPGPGPGPGPAFSLTGSLPLSRAPSSPFTPVGGGSRGAGRRAGDSAASFSFGGGGSVGGSQASLGANASLGFGGFGGFGGGGFGSPIRRGSAVAAGGATGKRAGAFPTPPSTPWRKRLRSADAVAI